MADDFTTLWKQIEGDYPGMSGSKAQQLVNQGWQDVRDAKFWSWLRGIAGMQIPGVVSAGTVTATTGINTLTVSAAAATAFNALDTLLVQFAGPIGNCYQIRVGFGPFYSVAGWDTVSTLTLDRNFAETSITNGPYTAFKAYYANPDPANDFLQYISVLNPTTMYWISGDRLTKDQEWLNTVDPQRGSTGDPFYFVSYNQDAAGLPIVELWPTPQNAYGLVAYYRKRGLDLTTGTNLPPTIERNVVEAAAQIRAAKWAMVNAGRIPELRGVNWVQAVALHQAMYRTELTNAKMRDQEVALQGIIRHATVSAFPIDGSFLQSHAPWGPAI